MAPRSRGKKAGEPTEAEEINKTTVDTRTTEIPKEPKTYPSTWKTVSTVIAIMALAGLASPVSQANLSPVYGSIPTSSYHNSGIIITTIIAFVFSKLPLQEELFTYLAEFLPVMAYWIPLIQWALFPYSQQLGVEIGPLITEVCTFFPLLLLAYFSSEMVLEGLDVKGKVRRATDSLRPAIGYGIFYITQRLSNSILPTLLGKADFLSRTGLSLLIGTVYAVLARGPWLLLCSPAVLHTLFMNPHHQSPTTDKVLNKTLGTYQYSLLERRDSVTGYISVLEDAKNGYRVLRCDHSLLGGEWLVTEERAKQGQVQRETIYSVFTMLEAVRLVEGAIKRVDTESNALFIGLGIGTSPTAFINHGINTTIVELDPVVHEFATKYFNLPQNHTSILADAVAFVSTSSITQPKSFDYIVHDVFTGGAEPTALFTLEFLQGLDALLKDDGVVAINYAGDITLPPPRIILNTITTVFPTCRIFRDAVIDPLNPSDFINMVVFCTKSTSRPLTFRKGTEKDWRGSLSRREYVPPGKELEIKMEDVTGGEDGEGEGVVLRKGNEWVIERFHKDHAMRHWGLMRTVVPAGVWENW